MDCTKIIDIKYDPVDCRMYVHCHQIIVCRFLHLRSNGRHCRRCDHCRISVYDVAQLQAPGMLFCPASSLFCFESNRAALLKAALCQLSVEKTDVNQIYGEYYFSSDGERRDSVTEVDNIRN